MEIIENTSEFSLQMDYEKLKKASMMQTALKMTAQKHL